jgi:hypothetical protein
MNVYFVRAKDHALMKIGKATDVGRRLKEIQTSCPYELEIMGVIKCKSEAHAFAVEKMAHEYLENSRTHGEWFRHNNRTEAVLRVVTNRAESLKDAYQAFRAERNRTRKQRKKDQKAQYRELCAHIRDITRT